MNSFEELKRQHGLNNSDFFRFLQVRHHINSSIPDSQKVFENELLNVFISAYGANSGLRIISRLYKALQGIKATSSTYIKQKWEREANSLIAEEVWTKYCEFQWKI